MSGGRRLTVKELNDQPNAVPVSRHTSVLPGDRVYLIPHTRTAPQAAYSEPEVEVVAAWASGSVRIRLAGGEELTTSGENVRHRRPDRRGRGGDGLEGGPATVRVVGKKPEHINPAYGTELALFGDDMTGDMEASA